MSKEEIIRKAITVYKAGIKAGLEKAKELMPEENNKDMSYDEQIGWSYYRTEALQALDKELNKLK